MTARDMEELEAILSKARNGKLQMLKKALVLYVPTARRFTKKKQLIEATLARLRRITWTKRRLESVARVYCWLASGHVLFPWLLYRVNTANENLVPLGLHRRMKTALSNQGNRVTMAALGVRPAHFACIMVAESDTATRHHVLCMCIWNGLKYVALWTTKSLSQKRLDRALRSVLQSSRRESLAGSFCSLRSALWRASGRSGNKSAKRTSP